MKSYRKAACFFVGMTLAISAVAQSYYDDDIYYNADKARKEKADNARQESLVSNQGKVKTYGQPLPGSDTYTVYTDNNRDVDEYNRRYSNSQAADTLSYSSQNEEFANTRNIERFYNDRIVLDSGDEILIEYYSDAQRNHESFRFDINVINAFDIWAPYYWHVYRPYWGYTPWYYSAYDPWVFSHYYGCYAWCYPWAGMAHWHSCFHYNPRPYYHHAYYDPGIYGYGTYTRSGDYRRQVSNPVNYRTTGRSYGNSSSNRNRGYSKNGNRTVNNRNSVRGDSYNRGSNAGSNRDRSSFTGSSNSGRSFNSGSSFSGGSRGGSYGGGSSHSSGGGRGGRH